MGTTADFLKQRSTGMPCTGEWNINFAQAKELAKNNGKFLITCWSNGDICGNCTISEKCMMDKVFVNWRKKTDAYFIFQCSDDADGGKAVYDWIYGDPSMYLFPGFRISYFDRNTGKVSLDRLMDGNKIRRNKTGTQGAQAMVALIEKIMSFKPSKAKQTGEYKIRFNEKLSVKKVNAILDAIDKNGGYCPCQKGKTKDTKCHCKDFKENKGIGEPCICNIYIKKEK